MNFMEVASTKTLAVGAGLSSAGGLLWGAISYDAVPVMLGVAGGIALGIAALWQRIKDDRLIAIERRLTDEILAHDATRLRLRKLREEIDSAEHGMDH